MKLITKLILLGAAVVLLLFLGSTLGFLGFGLMSTDLMYGPGHQVGGCRVRGADPGAGLHGRRRHQVNRDNLRGTQPRPPIFVCRRSVWSI